MAHLQAQPQHCAVEPSFLCCQLPNLLFAPWRSHWPENSSQRYVFKPHYLITDVVCKTLIKCTVFGNSSVRMNVDSPAQALHNSTSCLLLFIPQQLRHYMLCAFPLSHHMVTHLPLNVLRSCAPLHALRDFDIKIVAAVVLCFAPQSLASLKFSEPVWQTAHVCL